MGAYYSELELDRHNAGQRNVPFENAGLGAVLENPVLAPLYAPVNPLQLDAVVDFTQGVSTYAVFTDVRYQLNDQWDILGGARWDHEEQENSADTNYLLGNKSLLPDPASAGPYAFTISDINTLILQTVASASGVEPLVDAEFNTCLPKLGISYHWNDDMTTSFTVQEGYRSGGVGSNTAKAATFSYDPEYTSHYELSFRSVWLDGMLIVNANIFYIDWKDQLVRVQLSQSTYDTETRNVGKSVVQGFEVELSYQANDTFRVYSSLGQAETEFKSTIPGATPAEDIVADRSFADAPEWTASIGATYTAGQGLFANISANYADSSAATNTPWYTGSPYDPQNDSRTHD